MTTAERPEFDAMDHEVPEADLEAVRDLAMRMQRERYTRGIYPVTFVEIGAWAGRTTRVLAEYADVVFAVDHWEGSPGDRLGALAALYGARAGFQTFCRNMGRELHRKVFPCVGRSSTWAAIWRTPIDLIYIDADHRYEAVKADIEAWRPHLRPGGIIAGHDYHLAGVARAVDELFTDFRLVNGRVWYVESEEG